MIGDSGVGKTSLLASLCNEIKDNGNGFSRNYMLKHKHEKVNGLSHTFKKEILGLNNNILNYFNSSYDEIYSSNSIIVNLFDTAGSSSKRSNMLYILSSIITDMLFLVKKDDKNDKNHVFNNLFNIYSKYFNINNDMKVIINISDKSNDDFNFNSTNNIYFSNITHNNLDKIYSKIMLLNNINNNNHNNCILDSCFRILDKYDINNNTNTNNIIVSGIQCIGHLTTNTNVYIYNNNGEYQECFIQSIYKQNNENKNIYYKESGEVKLLINKDNNITINKNTIIVNNIINNTHFRDIIEIKLIDNKLIDEKEYIVYNGNMIYNCIYLKNKLLFNKKVLIQNDFFIICDLDNNDNIYIAKIM